MSGENTLPDESNPLLNQTWAGLVYVFDRFTTLAGVISLASFFNDLQIWLNLIKRVILAAEPLVGEAIKALWDLMVSLAAIYRGLVYPIFDTLFNWLPFMLPEQMKDIIFIATFSIGWAFRGRRTLKMSIDVRDNLKPANRGQVSSRARKVVPWYLKRAEDKRIRAWFEKKTANAPKQVLTRFFWIFFSIAASLGTLSLVDMLIY